MKKVLFLSIIVLCGMSFTKAQDVVNLRMDRQQMGLRGSVASMDEDILLRKDYFREDWPTRKWFVNDLRNVLREDNGRVVTFNQAGRMTSITYTHQGRAGKKTTCSYAANGLLSSFVGEGYRVEAKYNGNYADINVFAETRDYPASVNLAKADLNTAPYTNSYPFDLKCKQELTDDGLVLNSSYYYVDSMPAKVCEYQYNYLNLLTNERVIDYTSNVDGVVSVIRYSYDNRGFLIKKVVHSVAVDETYTYENNDLGDCVKMTIERPYGTSVYTFVYEYDTMDNWVVRLQFLNGTFDNAAVRTLTYHPAPKAQKPQPSKAEKEAQAAQQRAEKERLAVERRAEKERLAAEKQAEKERLQNMTPEQRRAEKERLAAEQRAEKERLAAERRAEKERLAAEKRAEKERLAAERRAEKERLAAEQRAEKERLAAERRAEKERRAAEKQAEKERRAAEKAANK